MGFQNTFRDNLELRKVKAPQGLYGSQVIFLGLFISKNNLNFPLFKYYCIVAFNRYIYIYVKTSGIYKLALGYRTVVEPPLPAEKASHCKIEP